MQTLVLRAAAETRVSKEHGLKTLRTVAWCLALVAVGCASTQRGPAAKPAPPVYYSFFGVLDEAHVLPNRVPEWRRLTQGLLGGDSIPPEAERLLAVQVGWHFLALTTNDPPIEGRVSHTWMSGVGPALGLSPQAEGALVLLCETKLDRSRVQRLVQTPAAPEVVSEVRRRLSTRLRSEPPDAELSAWFDRGMGGRPDREEDFARAATLEVNSVDLNGDGVPDSLATVQVGVRHLAAVLLGGLGDVQLLRVHGVFGPAFELDGSRYVSVDYLNPEVGDYPQFLFKVVDSQLVSVGQPLQQ